MRRTLHLLAMLAALGCDDGAPIAPPTTPTASASAAMPQPTAAAPAVGPPDSAAATSAATQPPDAGHAPLPADAGSAPPEPARTDAGATASDSGSAAAAGLPGLCSGCAEESVDPMDMTLHLHHVHLNVADRERSARFYETHLAAERVLLNGASEALHVEPVLLLMDERAATPVSKLPSALQHVGWGSSDVSAWYTQAHAQGVAPDTRGFTLFETKDTPTVGEPGTGATAFALLGAQPPPCFPIADAFSYMYVLGPDQERIEVWTGADMRINHVHYTSSDIVATASWYQSFLGIADPPGLTNYAFFLDDILFFFEPLGVPEDYLDTDDHVLGHVAFSVSDLDRWFRRAQENGVEIVSEPAAVHGFRSFFTRGPDGILVELVQAAPSAELCPGN